MFLAWDLTGAQEFIVLDILDRSTGEWEFFNGKILTGVQENGSFFNGKILTGAQEIIVFDRGTGETGGLLIFSTTYVLLYSCLFIFDSSTGA